MLPPAPPRPAPPHEYVLLAGTVPSRPVPPRSPPRTNFSSSPPVPGAGRAVPRPGQRRAGRGRPAPPLRATAAATHSPVTGTTASRPPPRLGPAPRRPRGAPRTNGGRGPRPPKAVRRRAPGGRRCPGGSGCGRRAPPRREAALSRAPRPAALQRRPAAATGAEGPPPAGEGAERQRQVPGARRVRRAILPQIPAPAHLALGEIRSSPHNPELRSLSRILTRPCPAAFRTR